MEEQETFMMLDEFGLEKEAKILNVVEINNQDYIVYAISKNEEEDNVYVEKIIRDNLGNEEIVSIDNNEEKELVFEIIRNRINELE